MKPLLKLSLFGLMACLLSACAKPITPLESLLRDQHAAGLIKLEKSEEALEQYVKILEDSPNEPQVHSNIGVLLSQTQKPEDAFKSYELARQLAEIKKDSEALFAIHYNLGTYYGSQKKIPEAIEHYQAALELLPTSKETKHNIELLIQQQNQKGGKGESKDQDDKDQKNESGKDQNDDKKEGDQKPEDEKDGQDPKKDKDYKGNAKYKPRPYKGDQLSEGDVKKILGELKNQEQKIRANFDKKERKEPNNEKDW